MLPLSTSFDFSLGMSLSIKCVVPSKQFRLRHFLKDSSECNNCDNMFKHLFVFSTLVLCVLAQKQAPAQDGPPEPYQFNYASQDKEGSSSHEESGDGSGKVTGKYTLMLADGRMRVVTYWADESGFHADVMTNEQGTESKDPADVKLQSTAPTGAEAALAAGSEMIATIVKAPRGLRPVHAR